MLPTKLPNSSSALNGLSFCNTSTTHHHLYLTPLRDTYAGSAVSNQSHRLSKANIGRDLQQSLPSYYSTCQTVCVNSVKSEANDEFKDRCDHQASFYRRQLCEHCGENFCDSCEVKHKELLKTEILKMGEAFLCQDIDLDRSTIENQANCVRDHLSVFAEGVRQHVNSEISNTENKLRIACELFFNKLRSDADLLISRAFEMRDIEVSDIIWISNQAVNCQENKARIDKVIGHLRKNEVCFSTLNDMVKLNREMLRFYGMNCGLDALRDCTSFYSQKSMEFNLHPGFEPMVERCLDFFRNAQLGTLKFPSPIRKIRDMLLGKQNFDSSPFKPLFGSASLSGTGGGEEFLGKSFYDRMQLISFVSGKDADSWDIRKPFGLVWLTNTEYLAVVHRPKRITLITVKGEIRATYRFADPDYNQNGGLNFHGNLAADDEWKLYFIDEPGLRILSFNVKSNPIKNRGELAVPKVFARLSSNASVLLDNNREFALCNKMKFHGLAVGLARRELYTEAGDAIAAYGLVDGIPRFRCPLEKSHQFSSHVLGVMDRPNSISYLIYSTSHGNILHKKAFLSNGLLEESSSVIAFQGSSINCVSEVRGVATDPAGNLLLADSKNGCIKVFSESFQAFSSFGLGSPASFNPSAVAVAYFGSNKPVICVTEFSSHRILFFSA